MIIWKFKNLQDEAKAATGERISYRAIREATGISLSTLSGIATNRSKRTDLNTLNGLLRFFSDALGRTVEIGELLEFEPSTQEQVATAEGRREYAESLKEVADIDDPVRVIDEIVDIVSTRPEDETTKRIILKSYQEFRAALLRMKKIVTGIEDEARWRFIQDDDSHWYLIPADKAEECQAHFEAVYRYWDNPSLEGGPPDDPEWLRELDGDCTDRTFADPRPL